MVVDALEECISVTWNGYHQLPTEYFLENYNDIPEDFKIRFAKYRNFSKHLGHFYISVKDSNNTLKDQSSFDTFYDQIDKKEIESFIDEITKYRLKVLKNHNNKWLNSHKFYRGLRDKLKRLDNFYIVTAKDRKSVVEILNNANINLPKENIYGDCLSKIGALNNIAKIEKVNKPEICFFDDNVLNVHQANQNGFSGYWAIWGYNTPEHFNFSEKENIKKANIDFLLNFNL